MAASAPAESHTPCCTASAASFTSMPSVRATTRPGWSATRCGAKPSAPSSACARAMLSSVAPLDAAKASTGAPPCGTCQSYTTTCAPSADAGWPSVWRICKSPTCMPVHSQSVTKSAAMPAACKRACQSVMVCASCARLCNCRWLIAGKAELGVSTDGGLLPAA